VKKKILIVAAMALLVTATAFAADPMSDMYSYCQKAMLQQGGADAQSTPMGRDGAGGMMNGPMMMRSEYR
jgi:opacity protein-like surface antigen